jgi:hypothetical protein
LVGPPAPAILTLQGPMILSSNTLLVKISGRISFERNFRNPEESGINLTVLNPAGKTIQFTLTPVEPA